MSSLLQRNYLKIRNDYIIPITQHSQINLREYPHLKLKNAIFENFIDVSSPANNDFYFVVPKSIIDKAKISEIEQFYIRSIFQQSDFNQLTRSGTHSWLFTTQYYNLFFLATCMQRILNIGYFWIGAEEAEKLSLIISSYLPNMISLTPANYRFVIEDYNENNYKLLISKQGSNTHQQVWVELKSTITRFITNSSGEEKVFLENLKKTYNSMSAFSPASARNEINYSSKTSIEELNKEIYCHKINIDKIEGALGKIKLKSANINDKIKLTSIMAAYFTELISNLLGELASRQNKSCRLIRKYEKKYNKDIINRQKG